MADLQILSVQSVSERMISLRKTLGFGSKSALAKAIGVSISLISKYENCVKKRIKL